MNRTKPWAIKLDGWTGPDRSIIPNRPLDKVNLTGQLGTRKVTGFNPTMTGRADTSGDVSGRYANEGVKARRIKRRCHWLMLCYWRKEIAKEEIEWHAWDPRLRVTHSGAWTCYKAWLRVTARVSASAHVGGMCLLQPVCGGVIWCVAALLDACRHVVYLLHHGDSCSVMGSPKILNCFPFYSEWNFGPFCVLIFGVDL